MVRLPLGSSMLGGRLGLVSSLIACLSISWPVGASAQSADGRRDISAAEAEEARLSFEAGREHYQHGRYPEAMAAFEHAYEITQSPEMLYNVYTAAERVGDVERAERYLDAYLRTDLVPRDERAGLESRLQGLRRRLQDEQAAEEARRREAEEREQRAAEAEERALEAERLAAEGAPRVSAGAVAGFVTGGAGLLGFAVFAGLAKREDNRIAGVCGADAGRFCSDDQLQTLRTYTITADVALGFGIAGAATGLVLYFLQRPDDSDDDDTAEATAGAGRWQLSPVVGRDMGLSISGSF